MTERKWASRIFGRGPLISRGYVMVIVLMGVESTELRGFCVVEFSSGLLNRGVGFKELQNPISNSSRKSFAIGIVFANPFFKDITGLTDVVSVLLFRKYHVQAKHG